MPLVRPVLTTLFALGLLTPAGCDDQAKPKDDSKSAADKPTSDKPTADKPTADKPASDKPTADKPASDKPKAAAYKPASLQPLEGETHFASLIQLTNGGENAEAYLSNDETQLIFQTKRDGMECDQIFTMKLDGADVTRLSSGKGRTTCAYFLPGDKKVIYSSTHAAGPTCLPPPDQSHGYVWKLYDEFDIYVAGADGSDPKPLLAGPGYDAEATVSPKGDKIVFTSTRDGDPEIYTANIDGTGVTRLTNAKGYDGGPFFSADGTKIVYRANHPEGAEELAKYDEIIKKGLVRPTRLEIFVMDADGGNQTQITSNGKANFGPFFHPDGKRIIFASNQNDEGGRIFDLYIIGVDGKGQEQVTKNASFDGFPMFTRDGKRLIFSSNRNGTNKGDTNVFVAAWKD